MDVNSHAEELASDLGVDKEEVKADLQNLLEYSVPIDEAKQSVRRKHGGGGGGSTPTPDSVDVDEITTDHDGVTVTVRVLTQEPARSGIRATISRSVRGSPTRPASSPTPRGRTSGSSRATR